MSRVWILRDLRVTEQLGAAIGRHCPWEPGDPRWLFLSGVLGAGKTTLTAAIFAELGVHEVVRSPTYALIETYPIRTGLAVHIDLYRLRGAEELEQLGLRDYLQAHTLLVVEWPERMQASLPQPDLLLRLEMAAEGRVCRAEAFTAAGETWLTAVDRDMLDHTSSEIQLVSP